MNPNRIPRGLHFALLFLALSGCSAVTSSEILGEPSPDEELADLSLDGVWNLDGEAFYVQRISGNELRVAVVKWEDNKFQLQETTILFTTEEDVPYVVALNPDSPPERPEYFFMRLLMAGNSTIVLLPPNPEAFQEAVEKGVLTGDIKKEQYTSIVQLKAAKTDLASFVDPAKVNEQFDLKMPIVLKRMTSPAEAKPK